MSNAIRDTGYSVENALEFGWGSGDLTAERRYLLDTHVRGRTVLDAGCGVGGFVTYLSQRNYDATGLDKHDFFLAVARQKGFRGNFVRGDLSSPLPFRDRTFDTTLCLDVLEHLENDVATFQELVRVTRQRLVIAVPQEDTWMPRYGVIFNPYRDPTHLRYYTRESLGELVTGPWATHVSISGEYLVKVQQMALDLLVPGTRGRGLSSIYRRLFRFLVNRTPPPQIFNNLVAVIDLRTASA